jgi:hypothetical protein
MWPWQFALRKAQWLLFVNINRDIPFTNTSGWSAVVSCVCEIIQLFSAAFHVVRFVNEFYFRLTPNDISGWSAVVSCVCEIIKLFSGAFHVVRLCILNETHNKWRPAGRSCGHTDSCFWQDLYVFPRPSSPVLRDSTHATMKVICILLCNRLYNHSYKICNYCIFSFV